MCLSKYWSFLYRRPHEIPTVLCAKGLNGSIKCFNRRQIPLGTDETRHQPPDLWFQQCEVPVDVSD